MTTLFSFGYAGWGNATDELVRAADSVETARGFAPPLFVDTRIRRAVRAKGFQGAAFEKTAGPGRSVWMPKLGNKHIVTHRGPQIQVAHPEAADDLLDLALTDRRRRVIFFCSCEWPRENGEMSCHRTAVADLLVKAAKKRGNAITVIEWPGGEPRKAELKITPALLKSITHGRTSVPMADPEPLADWAGLPWGSTVTLLAGKETADVVSGPARVRAGGWQLPVIVDASARDFRRGHGLEPRTAGR